MMKKPVAKHRGFSLVEIMIAVLFISIAFFGYVALHSRILHSGQKLEEKEVIRSATDFFEAIEVARVTLGNGVSLDGQSYPADGTIDNFYRLTTSNKDRDTSWKSNYPESYHPGMEETLDLVPDMLSKPHSYSWEKR